MKRFKTVMLGQVAFAILFLATPAIVEGELASSAWQILVADKGGHSIMILDGAPNGSCSVLWRVRPENDQHVAPEDRASFADIDEIKVADGGGTLFGCASSGAYFGLDVATSNLLFYGRMVESEKYANFHSLERLPDGRYALAASTGVDRIFLLDLNGHPFQPKQQVRKSAAELSGAHGVVWDNRRDCLFALGYTNLVRYAYSSKSMQLKEEGRWNYMLDDNDFWGHDLVPDGHGGYYFTTARTVRRFDPDAGRIEIVKHIRDAKSFSPSESRGDLYAIPEVGYWAKRVTIDMRAGGVRTVPLPAGAAAYKFRWRF